MAYTLRQAAAATGRHRSSLLRCIQDGKLSATCDPVSGSWLIEPAELHRLFAPITGTGDSAEQGLCLITNTAPHTALCKLPKLC